MSRVPLDLELVVANADGSDAVSFPVSANRDAEDQAFIKSITHKLNTGFESMSADLPRDMRKRYNSPRILQEAKVKGATGSVWEGRIHHVPASRSGVVEADGWWSAMKAGDMGAVSEVYVDIDPSHWGEMSLNRKKYLVATLSLDLAKFGWTQDNGLMLSLPNELCSASSWSSGGWYAAPAGAKIAKVMYYGNSAGMPGGWSVVTAYGDDDTAALSSSALTLDGSPHTLTLATARQYLNLLVGADGTAATPTTGAYAAVYNIGAFGDHGLTTYATSSSNYPQGVYASDVIKHAVGKYCPLITADSSTVAGTTYSIGHLLFDGASVEDVVLKCNAYHLYEMAVREDRKFWFQPQRDLDDYDFELSIFRGDSRDIIGPVVDDDEPCNGVWVYYPDANAGGQTKRVGPLGTASDYDSAGDASLLVTDPENPCNRAGDNRFPKLGIGWPVVRADAILLGLTWLAEKQVPTTVGTGVAVGYVRNRAGAEVPAYTIRDGDRVRYSDEGNIIRRVYGASYDPASCRNSLSFERPSMSYDGLTERINLQLMAAGIK